MNETPAPEEMDPSTSPPSEATFQQFLSGMAMQTLMHLGLMSNPMTNETEVDLVQAKYSIDLLGILEEKTRGNLTEEEENYFKPMLAQLRMGYVDAMKRETSGATEAGQTPPADGATHPQTPEDPTTQSDTGEAD